VRTIQAGHDHVRQNLPYGDERWWRLWRRHRRSRQERQREGAGGDRPPKGLNRCHGQSFGLGPWVREKYSGCARMGMRILRTDWPQPKMTSMRASTANLAADLTGSSVTGTVA
jgi:hypothetical protein